MYLRTLGWNSFVEEQWNAQPRHNLIPARVIEEQRQAYRVVSEFGEMSAEITGHLRHHAAVPSQFPSVGDWVAVRPVDGEQRVLIHEVLPRRSKLSRKVAGERLDEQIVVANVDTVMIVTSLNGDLNPRRIERYLGTVWDSGAVPVLVLSKRDLCPDVQSVVDEMTFIAPGVNVHAISANSGEGMDELRAYLGVGSTVVLVGSSGVGKSTIINRLLQAEVQITRPVRDGDDRGRHATTARRLFPMPSGGVLIDTPGIRELQLWDGGGLDDAFDEIGRLAKDCRFRDCQHRSEPGCAVLKAIADDVLDAERLTSYNKLQRELEHLERRRDPAAQSEQRKRWKQLTKAARQQMKRKR